MTETCKIMDELNEKELSHRIEYTDEFYRLSDDEQDEVLQDEEQAEKYIVDLDEENKFTEDMRWEKGSHLSTCTHENCNRIRAVWADNSWLGRYIKNE